MRISNESVDAWLQSIDDDRADQLFRLDALISDVFAGESRVLWVGRFWGGTNQTIIGYGNLIQSRSKGDDVHWFVVGLAMQKTNISIYVNAVKDGEYLGKVYGKRLGKVKLGSASIGFKTLADLNQDVIKKMLADARELTDA